MSIAKRVAEGNTSLAISGTLNDALAAYRTICWDYRGLYTSAAPADPRANTMSHHVGDLAAILEAEQVGDFVIAGWSMGVQVALEAVRRHRDRVKGIFAINGTYGRAFHTVMGSRLMGQTIPMLLRPVRAQAALVGRATKRVAGSDAMIGAMKRVGMVSETVDLEIFRAVAAGFQQIDWVVYSDMLARLVVWAGARRVLAPTPHEVESIHRIPVDEFLRDDAPQFETIPESDRPVLRMPGGTSWIAAPTAAIFYQFREVCIHGRPTRVGHFEQPTFAWR